MDTIEDLVLASERTYSILCNEADEVTLLDLRQQLSADEVVVLKQRGMTFRGAVGFVDGKPRLVLEEELSEDATRSAARMLAERTVPKRWFAPIDARVN